MKFLRSLFFAALVAITLSPKASLTNAQNAINLTVHYATASPLPNAAGHTVTAFISILDANGNAVSGLTESAFTVSQNGQPIQEFEVSPVSAPLQAVLVMDLSESMIAGGRMQAAIDGSTALVNSLNTEDAVALITFESIIEIVYGFGTPKESIVSQLRTFQPVPGGQTCLWDAIYLAVELAASQPDGQRAIIVMTDGDDYGAPNVTCSSKVVEDVIGLATSAVARVPIFAIGISTSVNPASLERLSALTGGKAYFARNSSEIEPVFSALANQFANQYQITYNTNLVAGEHQVSIQVDVNNVIAQGIRPFYAPPQSAEIRIEGIEPGQALNTPVQIIVGVSGDTPVQRVTLLANGAFYAEDTIAPFVFPFDSAEFPEGSLTLQLIASDSNGAIIAERTIEVLITRSDEGQSTPPDDNNNGTSDDSDTLPSLDLIGLRDGQKIEDDTRFEIVPPAGLNIKRVEVRLGNVLIVSDESPPFEAIIATSDLVNGINTIQINAFTEDGSLVAQQSLVVVYESFSLWSWVIVIAITMFILGFAGIAGIFLLRRNSKPKPVAEDQMLEPSSLISKEPNRAPRRTLAKIYVVTADSQELVGRNFELWNSKATIGRGIESDITLPDSPVSRNHAEIVFRQGANRFSDATVDQVDGSIFRFYVKDCGSTYGTFLNDRKLEPHDEESLTHNDIIRLGPRLTLKFLQAGGTGGSGGQGDKTEDIYINDDKFKTM